MDGEFHLKGGDVFFTSEDFCKRGLCTLIRETSGLKVGETVGLSKRC